MNTINDIDYMYNNLTNCYNYENNDNNNNNNEINNEINNVINKIFKIHNILSYKKNENKYNICVICLENNNINNNTILYCKHIFHKECIEKWFEHNKTCPICKRKN